MKHSTASDRTSRLAAAVFPLTIVIECCLWLSICLAPARAAEDAFAITVLSNRADKISGGDALVRVRLPDSAASGNIVVRRDGEDITHVFRADVGTVGSMTGLVTGLRVGPNRLEVLRKGDPSPVASTTVTNHPISGPVFSGPQERPFVCQTEAFLLPNGTTLGKPLDENCSVRTVVSYVYRSNAPVPTFQAMADTTAMPEDVAWTTTSEGRQVPYIVRLETGVINRSIYQIAMLHDPVGETGPDPWVSPKGWNRRLLYSFGGGCMGGWFKQGSTLGTSPARPGVGLINDSIVGRGYAHASASLNVFGNNCQDVTAAETLMMVKEHFIESYGVPAFTFGRGGSGGAYQQIQIADNYPGLLDGIIPSATFPDVLATIQFLTDIQLLHSYFTAPGNSLTEEQQRLISGVGNYRTIAQTAPGADRIKAAGVCPSDLPVDARYHPESNPTGARCNVFDHTVNVYGRDPNMKFARRPVDNTGVQYGLASLNDGVITMSQFLDLNEKIGGYDNDGNVVPTRSVASLEAERAAYETGRVTNGGGGLASIPIIDSRGYLDDRPSGDLHLKYHSFALRERLLRANGTAANQVLLVTAGKPPENFEAYTITKMDEWLTNLSSTASSAESHESSAARVLRAKPADLVDACYSPDGERVAESQVFAGGVCNNWYPTFPSPRMIAGGPVTNDILKCQLKPVDAADYRVKLSASEQERLERIFPHGVCDWSKPGVGQTALRGTWLSY